MSDMVNVKKGARNSSVSCFKEDKALIDAICFTYKMKQNELLSGMLETKMREILKEDPETAKLIEMMIKNSRMIEM